MLNSRSGIPVLSFPLSLGILACLFSNCGLVSLMGFRPYVCLFPSHALRMLDNHYDYHNNINIMNNSSHNYQISLVTMMKKEEW